MIRPRLFVCDPPLLLTLPMQLLALRQGTRCVGQRASSNADDEWRHVNKPHLSPTPQITRFILIDELLITSLVTVRYDDERNICAPDRALEFLEFLESLEFSFLFRLPLTATGPRPFLRHHCTDTPSVSVTVSACKSQCSASWPSTMTNALLPLIAAPANCSAVVIPSVVHRPCFTSPTVLHRNTASTADSDACTTRMHVHSRLLSPPPPQGADATATGLSLVELTYIHYVFTCLARACL